MAQTKTLSTKFRYRDVFQKIGESDPKIWGPKTWKKMFDIAGKYPKTNPTENQKQQVYDYFKNLKLPCKQCQYSYNLYWNQIPIEDYLPSRKLMIEWVYIIKNKVNIKLMQREKNREVAYTQQCLQDEPEQMNYCVEYGKQKQTFHTISSPPLEIILNRYY